MTHPSQSTDQVWFKVSTGCIVTLILCLIMFSLDANAFRNKTYYVPYGAQDNVYLADEQLSNFETESKLMCLMLCNHNEQCQSISYNSMTKICQHYRVTFWGRHVTETDVGGWMNYDPFKAWDCKDLFNQQFATGIYTICPGLVPSFSVKCDMDHNGGGWTVIQRRYDGTVDFRKSWLEYKTGFGSIEGEFWLGNDRIHAMTTSAAYELRIDIGDWAGRTWYAVYKIFIVDDEKSKYNLTIGDYSGTAGDSMKRHNGMFFTTMDVDNDIAPSMQCSVRWGGSGGWWFNDCDQANLNGEHPEGSASDGINWKTAKNTYESMKLTKMMIRRI